MWQITKISDASDPWAPPQLPTWDPSQGDLTREQGVYPTQMPKDDPTATAQFEQAGWMQCPNPKCGFWLSPQAKAAVEQHNGYFTCPKCQQSSNILQHLPWHGPEGIEDSSFAAGGGTRIGIPMADQAQIGENLVAHMGEIPGYGAITWWHPGGANANSPLDGATKEWGIEVKTLSMDDTHHRFVPGRVSEKTDKNNQAAEMGLKGILGILVMLDYRRDKADIYAKEMSLDPWEYSPGQHVAGVSTFRKNTGQKLVAEVPFDSPYKDPSNPSPTGHNVQDYYKTPQPTMPSTQAQPETQGMPF